jgi:hypothetical protein
MHDTSLEFTLEFSGRVAPGVNRIICELQYPGCLLRGLAILIFLASLYAQPDEIPDLARMQSFEARRTSSTNADLLSNDDAKRPIPGETLVLAALNGPGVITHIWMTGSNSEYGWPRLFRLRVYYDGSPVPSVDVPIGDFFGVGHGLERVVDSQMVRVSSAGRSRNCYWPMPFRRSCRITVTNEGRLRPASFYYHVDWKKVRALPPGTLYFHALYQQAIPAAAGALYNLLNIRGRGHYIGTVLSVVQTQPGWFGEGDESFYIDGDTYPTLHGTGTEDYFGDAYALHVSAGSYAGTTVADGAGTGARMTAYRWHIPDPIPFRHSLRFGFEHAGFVLRSDGSVKATFDERPDYFSGVAFWYQEGIASGLPVPPYGARRLPHGNALRIPAEKLAEHARGQQGTAEFRSSAGQGRGLLWFSPRASGGELEVPFEIPRDGRYELLLMFASGPAFGRFEVSLDGRALTAIASRDDEPERPRTVAFDGYAPEFSMARQQVLTWADLYPGTHRLTFRSTGKAPAAESFDLGIEALVVSEVGSVPPEPSAALRLRKIALEPSGSIAEMRHGLSDPDPEVRAAAAWALGQQRARASGAVPDLARALSDQDGIVRGLAAVALRETGPAASEAVPSLIKGLKDTDSSVRMICAEALGRVKAASAVPALIAVSRDPGEDLHVLRNVVAALGEMGPAAEAAIPALEALKSNPRLRYPAEAAQRKILPANGR